MTVIDDGAAAELRTLLVDDHPLFRLGFAAAWRRARPSESLVEAADLKTARRLLQRSTKLVVLDLRLPDGLGLDLAPHARSLGVPFVILSTADAPAIVQAARSVGAAGFLSKELDPDALLLDIDRILHDAQTGTFPASGWLPRLSERELDVLGGLLEGLGNREIAARLELGVETVKTHVASLLARFGARDRLEVVRVARDLGYDVALPYLGDRSTA